MASLMGRARLMSTAELDAAEFFDTILSLALRRRQCHGAWSRCDRRATKKERKT